jgi:hypothetical protein
MEQSRLTAQASVRRLGQGLAGVVLLAAFILVGFGAYNLAWFQSVRTELAQAPIDAAKRARYLDEVRTRLGHAGFLQSMALYAETGRNDAREDMVAALDAADKSLRAFEQQGLTTAETGLARDIRRLIESYRRALTGATQPSQLAGQSSVLLMAQHAAMADRIADVRRNQSLIEIDQLGEGSQRGFWLGVGAVAVMVLSVAGVLALLFLRILRPLSDIRRGLIGVSRGDWRAPIWGTDREDEFGDLARIVDAFRVQAMNLPDISILHEDGRMRLKFEGGAADIFEVVSGKLREAGALLADNSGDVANTVGKVRTELTTMLGQVQSLCAAVARSASESHREIRQQSEVLGRAAAQVRAFDEQGPGGGLDALVAGMRRNAEALAGTIQDVGAEVGFALRGLLETESEIRAAASEARDATSGLATSIIEVQEKLLTAVRLIRVSGEFLNGTAGTAETTLARAVEAVHAGEQALATALARSTAQIQSATERLDVTVQVQLARAVGTLGDTEQSLADVLTRTTERLDGATGRMETAVEQFDSGCAIATQLLEHRSTAAERLFAERTESAVRALDERAMAAERIFEDKAELAQQLFDARAEFAEQRLNRATATVEGTSATLQTTLESLGNGLGERIGAEVADQIVERIGDRFQPLLEDFRALQGGIGASAADIAERSMNLTELLDELRGITSGLQFEYERRKVEPDRKAAGEATMRRLQDIADTLAGRMEAVEQLTQGLGSELTAALAEATDRLAVTAETITSQGEALPEALADAVQARIVEVGRALDSRLAGTVAAADGLADRVGAALDSATGGLRSAVEQLQGEIEALAERTAESASRRLAVISDQLDLRLKEVDETAATLSKQLSGGLDAVLERLRDAAGDVQQQSRALTADATTTANALARSVVRQDQTTEALREIAEELAAGDRSAVLAKLIDGLKGRLESMDRLAGVLQSATGAMSEIAEERAGKAANAAQAMQIGDRLAEIAEQLRAVAGDALPPQPTRTTRRAR